MKLEIYAGDVEVMSVPAFGEDCEAIYVSGDPVKEVQVLSYSGLCIGGDSAVELNRRLGEAGGVFDAAKTVVLGDRRVVGGRTKAALFDAEYAARLVRGAATWSLSEAEDARRLRDAASRYLRLLRLLPLPSLGMGVTPPLLRVRRRQLAWLKRLESMDSHRSPRVVWEERKRQGDLARPGWARDALATLKKQEAAAQADTGTLEMETTKDENSVQKQGLEKPTEFSDPLDIWGMENDAAGIAATIDDLLKTIDFSFQPNKSSKRKRKVKKEGLKMRNIFSNPVDIWGMENVEQATAEGGVLADDVPKNIEFKFQTKKTPKVKRKMQRQEFDMSGLNRFLNIVEERQRGESETMARGIATERIPDTAPEAEKLRKKTKKRRPSRRKKKESLPAISQTAGDGKKGRRCGGHVTL